MRHSRVVILWSVLLMLVGRPALAQPGTTPDSRALADRLAALTNAIEARQALVRKNGQPDTPATRQTELRQALDFATNNRWALAYYAVPPETLRDAFRQYLSRLNALRVDQAVGNGVPGGSSTGLASRSGMSALFDVALESGAVTQTFSQTSTTVRANAEGLARFLSNQPLFPTCTTGAGCQNAAGFGWLRNLDLGATFKNTEADTQAVNVTPEAEGPDAGLQAAPSQNDLTGFTARFALTSPQDLRSPAYLKAWLKQWDSWRASLDASGGAVLEANQPIDQAINDLMNKPDAPFKTWLDHAVATLGNAAEPTDPIWQQRLAQQLDILLGLLRAVRPTLDQDLAAFASTFSQHMSLQRNLQQDLVFDPAFVLEYTYSRPGLELPLHTAKLVWAWTPHSQSVGNPGTLTVNGGVSFYRDRPMLTTGTTQSRWRSAQAAVQFDRALGLGESTAVLTLGAYVQYQINPSVITIPEGATAIPGTSIPLPPTGARVLGERGTIVAAQALLTLKLPGNSLKVPIGLSWANRSDLAAGGFVRGHVGVTFDAAALFLSTAGR